MATGASTHPSAVALRISSFQNPVCSTVISVPRSMVSTVISIRVVRVWRVRAAAGRLRWPEPIGAASGRLVAAGDGGGPVP